MGEHCKVLKRNLCMICLGEVGLGSEGVATFVHGVNSNGLFVCYLLLLLLKLPTPTDNN